MQRSPSPITPRSRTPDSSEPPNPESQLTLARHDVVKLHLGAHIDGFAAIAAETLVVGATTEDPVKGRRADVLCAAWHAAELAMRTVRVDNKNWNVTDIVSRAVNTWDCRPVEGERVCDVEMAGLLMVSSRDALMSAGKERHRW